MKGTIMAGTLALGLMLSAGVAAAGDVQGTVKSIEIRQKVLTLEDGTQLVWTDDVSITEQLQSGDVVKATYQEKDGRLVLRDILLLQ
jgi:hypothetical protein